MCISDRLWSNLVFFCSNLRSTECVCALDRPHCTTTFPNGCQPAMGSVHSFSRWTGRAFKDFSSRLPQFSPASLSSDFCYGWTGVCLCVVGNLHKCLFFICAFLCLGSALPTAALLTRERWRARAVLFWATTIALALCSLGTGQGALDSSVVAFHCMDGSERSEKHTNVKHAIVQQFFNCSCGLMLFMTPSPRDLRQLWSAILRTSPRDG